MNKQDVSLWGFLVLGLTMVIMISTILNSTGAKGEIDKMIYAYKQTCENHNMQFINTSSGYDCIPRLNITWGHYGN